eukprot:64566-Pyramimonas_sp.AAC.2
MSRKGYSFARQQTRRARGSGNAHGGGGHNQGGREPYEWAPRATDNYSLEHALRALTSQDKHGYHMAKRGTKGHLGTHRDIQGHKGTARDVQGHLGTCRDIQGHRGTSRDIQGHTGASGDI